MGIFTRFKEIISSNINAMLDNAEDPEKLIRLMIREMEDTLIELRTSCAGVMAAQKKAERHLKEIQSREKDWEDKARLAVNKGRDDLARDALREKRTCSQQAEILVKESLEYGELIRQYQEDICQLDDKLRAVREKQRILLRRHNHAVQKKQARQEIYRIVSSQAFIRFDDIENRIEQMDTEADMLAFGKKSDLQDEFDRLSADDEIEEELQSLKSPAEKKKISSEDAK